MKKKLTLLVTIIALSSTMLFAQKTYDELSQITRLNRGVYGLLSMQDGEHYTVNKGGAILRHSYLDPAVCDTLYKGSFSSYEFTPAEDMIILGNNFRSVYRHSFYADYEIKRLSDKQVVASFKEIRDLSLSPDSKMAVFAKDNDLFVVELGKEPKAITSDGEWNKIINGTADWVYEEEYGFTKAYAFSPDSKQIAYLRFDESQVPEFEMMRFDGTLYNKPYSFKYPKAGDKNSIVELWLYDIASGEKHKVDVGAEKDQYIPFMASSAIPGICRPVLYEGVPFYDGALGDPVPIRKAFNLGCDKVVLILTLPEDTIRSPAKDARLARRIRREYPAAAEAMAARAEKYNEGVALARQFAAEGKLLILAPDDTCGVHTLCRDARAMKQLYAKGFADAEKIAPFLFG